MSSSTKLDQTARPARPMWQKALGIAALGLMGAGLGYTVAHLTDSAVTTWEDDLALAMAVATLGVAVITAFTVATRPSTVPKGCGPLQILVMALAGIMLLLPMFGTRVLGADAVFVGVLILLAVQVVANLMLWKRADEMLRQVMSETSALAFWALQTALFVYAAAERLGLVEGITAWGMTAILMAVYFLASILAAARRGIA